MHNIEFWGIVSGIWDSDYNLQKKLKKDCPKGIGMTKNAWPRYSKGFIARRGKIRELFWQFRDMAISA